MNDLFKTVDASSINSKLSEVYRIGVSVQSGTIRPNKLFMSEVFQSQNYAKFHQLKEDYKTFKAGDVFIEPVKNDGIKLRFYKDKSAGQFQCKQAAAMIAGANPKGLNSFNCLVSKDSVNIAGNVLYVVITLSAK